LNQAKNPQTQYSKPGILSRWRASQADFLVHRYDGLAGPGHNLPDWETKGQGRINRRANVCADENRKIGKSGGAGCRARLAMAHAGFLKISLA
jgi:hypothetical protein